MDSKLYHYKLDTNSKIDDKLIAKICSELDIQCGVLVIQRVSARMEKRSYVIDGNYKVPIYSNRYGARTKFR